MVRKSETKKMKMKRQRKKKRTGKDRSSESSSEEGRVADDTVVIDFKLTGRVDLDVGVLGVANASEGVVNNVQSPGDRGARSFFFFFLLVRHCCCFY